MNTSVWYNLHLFCRNTFLVLLILTCIWPAFTQSGYYYFDIDVKKGPAKGFHRYPSDNLSALLIDGYLKGKVIGYRYNIGGNMLKEIGTRYYFPTISDTLSKMEFLENMIYRLPLKLPLWSADEQYAKRDLVQYKESSYECIRHLTKGKPPTDMEYWVKIYNGPQIHSTQLEGIRMLMYREKKGNQFIHWPQMICFLSLDYNGYGTEIGLMFHYSDVLKYLATVPQPMLYQNGIGYMGNQLFILDSQDHETFFYWLQGNLKSGAIQVDDKSIVNRTSFDQFVQDTVLTKEWTRKQGTFNSPWSIYQDLVSNDIIIYETYLDKKEYKKRTTARLSIKNIEHGSPIKSVPFNFSAWLTSLDFNDPTIEPIELNMDSLPPMKFIPELVKPADSHFFVLNTNCESTENPSFVKIFPEIWTAVVLAFKEKRIQFKNRTYSFYLCEYDWPEGEIAIHGNKWSCPPGFSVNGRVVADIDTLLVSLKPNSFSVTYKKWLGPDSTKSKFEPLQITWQGDYLTKSATSPVKINTDKKTSFVKKDVYYTLDWNDLKKVLATKGTTLVTSFINTIENGQLKYFRSFVDYGLIEDK